jgi:N-acetylglutamate synthase-like GNAT family acetyltransferase
MGTVDHLITAVDEFRFLHDEVPGQVSYPVVPGVRVRKTPLDSPWVNTIGQAALSSGQLDETTRLLDEVFGPERLSYGWVVSPHSKPRELGALLAGDGLELFHEYVAMRLEEYPDQLRATTLQIREATSVDLGALETLIEKGFSVPASAAQYFARSHFFGSKRMTLRCYLVWDGDRDNVVSYGAAHIIPEFQTMFLSGAATLPEYRGRGAYQALLKVRIDLARRLGVPNVLVEADMSTSAPICQRLGFRPFAKVQLFARSFRT